MAADTSHNTIKFSKDNSLVISDVAYSNPTSARLLPFFSKESGHIEEMKLFPLPKLFYKISHILNGNEYKLEREVGSKKLKIDEIPSDKLIKLITKFFSEDVEKVSTKLFLDENFDPLVYGSITKVKFLGSVDSDKLVNMDLMFLKNILKKDIDSNEYVLVNEDSEIYHLGEANAQMHLLPYFYSYIESLYPGILVEYKSENSIKFSDEGIKIFLEFWARNLGLDSVYFNTTLQNEDLLALCPKAINRTRLSLDIANNVNSDSFIDFIEDRDLTHPESYFENINNEIEPPLEYDESGKVLNFKGFSKEIFSALVMPASEIGMWIKATWTCFINNYDKFTVGCDIIFAPQQVVLFQNGRLAFSSDEIISMKYVGKKHTVTSSRDTVTIINAPGVDNYFYTRVTGYFANFSDIQLNISELGEDES